MDTGVDLWSATSADLAVQHGEPAVRRLIIRSGAFHLCCIWVMAFLAIVGQSSGVPLDSAMMRASSTGLLGVGLGVGLGFGATRFGATLGILGCAVASGLLWGGASGPLRGAGVSFAFAAVVLETIAFALLLRAPQQRAPGVIWTMPVVIVLALSYGFEGTAYAVHGLPLAVGVAGATLFALHARLGEEAIAQRHGAEQWAAAAFSRWGEGLRSLIVRQRNLSVEQNGFWENS